MPNDSRAKSVPVPGPVGEVTDHFEVFGRCRRRGRGSRGRRPRVRGLGRFRNDRRGGRRHFGRRNVVMRRRRRCRPVTGYWRHRRRIEIACKRSTTNARENNYH